MHCFTKAQPSSSVPVIASSQGMIWLQGALPARSTRLTLADSMVMRPASSVVVHSTTQVNTEWDLLDSLFMLVAAVCLFCCPRSSKRAVSSTAGTQKWVDDSITGKAIGSMIASQEKLKECTLMSARPCKQSSSCAKTSATFV